MKEYLRGIPILPLGKKWITGNVKEEYELPFHVELNGVYLEHF